MTKPTVSQILVTILASGIAAVSSVGTIWITNKLFNTTEDIMRTDRLVVSALFPIVTLIFDIKQRNSTRVLSAIGFAVLYALAGFLF